jgi:hypothetical protein
LEWKIVKHKNRKGMWGGNREMEKHRNSKGMNKIVNSLKD